MKTKVTVFKKENYVVIYYSKNGKVLRYPTGISLDNKSDFSNRTGIRHTVKNFNDLNDGITKVKDKIDLIITEYYKDNGETPSVDYLKIQLNGQKEETEIKKKTTFLDYYNDFMTEKLNTLKRNGRDYKSFQNLIMDYELSTDKILTVDDITIKNNFFNDFDDFMIEERQDKKYKSNGGMKSSTRKKRFSVLLTFFTDLREREIITYDQFDRCKFGIKKVTKERLKKKKEDRVYITLEELKILRDEDNFPAPVKELLSDENGHRKALNLFLFACYTGMSISEVHSIRDKKFIKENGQGIVIHKRREKTDKYYTIPLPDFCIEVLEKYQYNLNILSSQRVNLYIKELLKHFPTFQNESEEKKKDGTYFQRCEKVGFHTGRRSFITNQINNNVPVNNIMSMTGHTQIGTLQEYVQETPINREAVLNVWK